MELLPNNMASFYSLYESSQTTAGKDTWFKPADVDTGYDIIKKGLQIRPDRLDGESFWDDFIAVLGQNTEEASKLLGVSRDKIAGWTSKIKKAMDVAKRETENEEAGKKKKTMLPTGV